MPEQTDGSLWGFQIWLNLPQRLQMSEPKYQDIPADAITVFSDTGVDYRLVAGELFGHRGPAETHLPTLMVDVSVSGGSTEIPIADGHTAILFCFEGALQIGGETITDGDLAVLSGDQAVAIQGEHGRGLLLASEPLNEPIARQGPFVLSNEGELKKAFIDYQLGQLAPNQMAFLASGGRG